MALTVQAAKAKFQSFDKNHSGTLNVSELTSFLRQGDPGLSDAEVALIFKQVDKNCQGSISMNEFIDFICDFSEGWQNMETIPSSPKSGGWIDVSVCEEVLSSTTKFIGAVDGSEISVVALNYLADDLLWKNRNTSVNIVHVYDDSKTYLPPALRKDAVKQMVESKLAGSVSSKRYSLTWLSKTGKSVGTHLCNLVSREDADFVVMGFDGLKGRKANAAIASNTYEVLKSSQCSVMVIKDESAELMPMKRPTVFVVSVSLNKASTKAFLDALRLSQPGDEIHVVYCKGFLEKSVNIYEHELRAKYEGFFGDIAHGSSQAFTKFHDRKCTFHVVNQHKNQTLPQAIVRHADGVGADFIVVGTNAMRVQRGKEPVGSVSMQICMETERNFIVSTWTG